MTMSNSIPSFQKVHYVLRPRKQIERKIIIELIQNTTQKLKLDVSDYFYLGMGSIHYYDFILFHKFLNISDMISLDDKSCVNRFEFNKPFDFIKFKNLSTTDYLTYHPENPEKNTVTWFDYDSSLVWYSQKPKIFRHSTNIFDDISLISKKSLENDFFLITVECSIPKELFKLDRTKDDFISTFKHLLSSKYQQTRNISDDNFPYMIQDIILNSIKNNEVGKAFKFRKLFSFVYQDTTPMYTLGGMFHSKPITARTIKNKYLLFDEDKITSINTPILTYKEKLHLDQKINYLHQNILGRSDEEIEELVNTDLGFELNCVDTKNYLEYYKYYPQYYEGIV